MCVCDWVCFGELGYVCVLGSVLESWDVYVCLGLFRRVGMCMCAWVCFGELGCVCVYVHGSVLESWDVCVIGSVLESWDVCV